MASETEPITGEIIAVRDCGAIVIVFLSGAEGRVLPVICEHRLFRHLLETDGSGPEEVVGRSVSYDGDALTFVE
jgi:hypothetical protein